jgi:Z1 domain
MLDQPGVMLEKAIFANMPDDEFPTEVQIVELAGMLRRAFPVDDDELAAILRHVEARLVIRMDLGTALQRPDHTPWLLARKAAITQFYWERYRTWLPRLGMTPAVANTLDRVSDEILDLCGDPTLEGVWSRRGLVVGDVQSGKTATYTALACKAADAGYRLIILLTGTLENLRRQTQERLDEGFVGLDSSEELLQPQIRKSRAIGVGIIDNRHTAGVFTSRSRDFSKQLMNQLGFRLDSFQQPVLIVSKKNKRILENLENWLKSYNAHEDGKISLPMIMIDDEADSASINTAEAGDEPTAINGRVRSLLELFHRSTYVGFTATPFANVFVDPDTESDMLGDDLFPSDFIYALEAPSNYYGPGRVFSDEALGVQSNDDAIAWFPPKHKSDLRPSSLPPSLGEAIRAFFVASTIRDRRRERHLHRSMLVNVSRFTAVQNQVTELVDAYVRQLQRDIRNYSQLSPLEAISNASIAALHDTWKRQFAAADPDWDAIQRDLNEGVQPITVRSVNQSASAASLDYKSYNDTGLRVIAVGGDSLSRGLTLEGLSTSYFYRNAQAYDTLLQMGRWFGYRDGYDDLCRIWISDEALHWYGHIWSATEELRDEFRRMRRLDLTPRDFGLKVRSHPDALMVTARNKMRTAQTIVREVSLSGNGIETARLLSGDRQLDGNAEVVSSFIGRLKEDGFAPEKSPYGSWMWRSVPAKVIAELLTDIQTHPRNHDFQSEALGTFLARTEIDALHLWDVALPQGSGDPEVFAGLEVRPQIRQLLPKPEESSLIVSGSKARVGSRGVEREGLEADVIERVVAEHPGENVSDRDYRLARTRPLLLLHVLRGTVGDKKSVYRPAPATPLIAIGLSFPAFDDSRIAGRVEYKVNTVEWKQLFTAEETDEDLGDDDLD